MALRLPGRAGLLGALTLTSLLVLACSSPSTPATQGPGATAAPPAATAAGQTTTPGEPVAGEPCSFLTGEQVTALVGTAPIEIKERAGRGDCDYWLDAGKTTKVNVGVTPGADGAALFESTRALGEPAPVASLGDEAYAIYLDSLGTLVMVKQGDAVAAVQLLNTEDPAEQAIRAIALARAVIAGL